MQLPIAKVELNNADAPRSPDRMHKRDPPYAMPPENLGKLDGGAKSLPGIGYI
jgi:hypothetical protein